MIIIEDCEHRNSQRGGVEKAVRINENCGDEEENFEDVLNLRSKAVLHRGTEMKLVFKVF